MGCLAEERFPDPVLVEAREDGRTVALALFNRGGRTLYLGQSGDATLDSIYVEFNGVLAEAGREASLTTSSLRAARRGPGSSPLTGFWQPRFVLGGVSAQTAASAAEVGSVRYNRSLAAPLVDLDARCFLARRSANTRQQLRRSNRRYAATNGVTIQRAAVLSEAFEFMDGLMELHQATWLARGQTGAFANPFFSRFHHALIARGLERGEIDLFRVAAGSRTMGFLYNFRYRGRSIAYQSGFDYAGAGRHEKPGMTCHYEAIRFAARWGAKQYHFLAGDDRYKRSLSDRAETLHWIEVSDPWSARSLAGRAWDFVAAERRLIVARLGASFAGSRRKRPDFGSLDKVR